MEVIKLVFRRKLKEYEIRHEIFDDSAFGGDGNLLIKGAYTYAGSYIGTTIEAHRLCVKRGLTKLQKNHSSHCVCSIGFNEKTQKWYGWSHRAICGFCIGDKIFEARFGNDQTPFIKHGQKTIKTLRDAKLAAKRFARYVS